MAVVRAISLVHAAMIMPNNRRTRELQTRGGTHMETTLMKAAILAVGLIAIGATTASAQFSPYSRGAYPYEQRHHSVCQSKARQLHGYERRSAADGRISGRERRTIELLHADLARTCGGFRWRG